MKQTDISFCGLGLLSVQKLCENQVYASARTKSDLGRNTPSTGIGGHAILNLRTIEERCNLRYIIPLYEIVFGVFR